MKLIGRHLVKRLMQSARPDDLDPIDVGMVAEPNVQRARRMRQVTAGGADLARENALALIHTDQSANGVAVALRATQPKFDPILGWELVLEKVALVVEIVDHDVE